MLQKYNNAKGNIRVILSNHVTRSKLIIIDKSGCNIYYAHSSNIEVTINTFLSLTNSQQINDDTLTNRVMAKARKVESEA